MRGSGKLTLRRPRSGGLAHRSIGPPGRHKGARGPFSSTLALRPFGETYEENFPTEHAQTSEEARLPPSHVDARRTGHSPLPAAEGPPPPVGLSAPDSEHLADSRPGDIC